MEIKSLVKVTGILGFIIAAAATYMYMTYILLPEAMPIIIHQVETQLSSEGIPITQSDISGFKSFLTTMMLASTLVGMFIGWLIEAAILMALLRAFKVRAGFTDTWLISGNYFYVNIVQTAIVAATPLLNYSINAIATHRGIMEEPLLLIMGLAFAVVGSLFLAYIFARIYGTGITKALIPTLIALVILWAISTII
ncbi:MAG: hypothetical protein ACP5NQ_05030 [Vulcanisaeta sp.]